MTGPEMIRRLWRRWERMARAIGNVQARVILTVLYVLLITPVALPLRFISDPLRRRQPGPSFWIPCRSAAITLDKARKQF